MPRRLRERFTYANVMSTLAVFLLLASGTAYASHLIVRSTDVVDGSLISKDLKNGFAVKGADVTNDSLTGDDIEEGTLGQVRTATVGGLGRSAADAQCDPETNSMIRCVEVQLDLSTPARVLLNGRVTAGSEGGVGASQAACRWGGVVESGPVFVGTTQSGADMSLVGITSVLPPGQGYTFAIECSAPAGAPGDVFYNDAWITALAVSPA